MNDVERVIARQTLEMAEYALKVQKAKKGTPAYDPELVKGIEARIRDLKRHLGIK